MVLDAKAMEAAFTRLGEIALEDKRIIDMAVYGGSALALAYDLRKSTKDVDAVFEKDKDFVRRAAAKVAEEMTLPDDWLNDAVKGYVSPKEHGNMIPSGSFPTAQNPGLRIFVPAPRYFFAMKCIDIRLTATAHDMEDVRKLALVCKIKNAQEALEIVESFDPDRALQQKTTYFLEELFETIDVNQKINVGRAGFDQSLKDFENKAASPYASEDAETKTRKSNDNTPNRGGLAP